MLIHNEQSHLRDNQKWKRHAAIYSRANRPSESFILRKSIRYFAAMDTQRALADIRDVTRQQMGRTKPTACVISHPIVDRHHYSRIRRVLSPP